MNTLSWLLYLAEVLHNLGIFLGIIGMIACLIGGAATLVSAVDKSSSYPCEGVDTVIKISSRILIAGLFALALSMLLPSKQAMYMIAVSEMGEEATKTAEFAKVRKIINEYLDEALENSGEDR